MISIDKAFSGFSVKDMAAARAFYEGTLGLEMSESAMGTAFLKVGPGEGVLLYEKPDHAPASFTVLNLPSQDVDATVVDLAAKGIEFKRYDGFPQDDNGVMHDNGPDIAWFEDPSGNVLSVIAE